LGGPPLPNSSTRHRHRHWELYFRHLLVIGTALMPYQGTGTVGKLPLGVLLPCFFVIQSLLGALVASRWLSISVLWLRAVWHHACIAISTLCTTNLYFPIHQPLHPALRQLANPGGLLFLCCFGYGRSGLSQVELLTVTPPSGSRFVGSLVVLLFWHCATKLRAVLNAYCPIIVMRPLPLICLAQ